jgi:hypothetical protein
LQLPTQQVPVTGVHCSVNETHVGGFGVGVGVGNASFRLDERCLVGDGAVVEDVVAGSYDRGLWYQ